MRGIHKIKLNGYVTVYLSLTLAVLLTLILLILYGARLRTSEYLCECTMDLGLNSTLAEYNRGMLDRYDLLFIDCGYGRGNGSIQNTKSHLMSYMNQNLEAVSGSQLSGVATLMQARADNASLLDVAIATDDSGAVFRYQIKRMFLARYGHGFLSNMSMGDERLKEYLGRYDGTAGERSGYKDKVDSIVEEYNSSLPEGETPVGVSNPADAVETLRDGSALGYAVEDIGSLNLRKIDGFNPPSKRTLRKGSGLRHSQSNPSGAEGRLLMDRFIWDYLGYFDHIRENSSLNYQVEYLYSAKDNDYDNLKSVAEDIFKIRYVVNMAHLKSSFAKQAEAEELAIAACSLFAVPELIEAVKWTILFAWGYAESAKDMRILYDGHSLHLTKSDSDWNTPLLQLMDFRAHLNEYSVPNGSMNYKKYLQGLLAIRSLDTVTMRTCDICESDVRLLTGDTNFLIDNCIYQFDARVNFALPGDKTLTLIRTATYE